MDWEKAEEEEGKLGDREESGGRSVFRWRGGEGDVDFHLGWFLDEVGGGKSRASDGTVEAGREGDR